VEAVDEVEAVEAAEGAVVALTRKEVKFLKDNATKVIRNPSLPEIDGLTVAEAIGANGAIGAIGSETKGYITARALARDIRDGAATLEAPYGATRGPSERIKMIKEKQGDQKKVTKK
jgi:hypothetical protein